jgi:type VI secretion system protein ImpM
MTAPGFYGKLPAAGDFVSRRLPPDFVRFWDRWTARHLVPRLASTPLLFLLATPPGPMLGIALASHDRAGRRFPLTLAAAPTAAAAALPALAAPWLATLTEAGLAATAGALDPPALDARLLALPDPPAAAGPPAPPLLLWTAGSEPQAADPEAPGPVLDALLSSG